MSPSAAALVVAVDVAARRALSRALGAAFVVHTAEDGDSAESVLVAHPIDVVVADARAVTALAGHEALADAAIVALVATPAEAAIALGAGAGSAMLTPVDAAWALAAARRAVASVEAARRGRSLEHDVRALLADDELIAVSPAMRTLERSLRRAASAPGDALILGEPGSGVSLVARRLHALGPFADRPLVVLSAAGLGDGDGRELVAALDEPGRAVVLEGVEALSAVAQDALVDLVERRAGVRRRAAPRLITTAAPSIRERAQEGAFRRDLLHGLSASLLEVPPLRRRLEDVPLLAQALLARATRRLGRPEVRRVGTEAIRALRKETWPGNVRELGEAIELAVLEASGDILLPSHFAFARGARSPEARREAAELAGVAPFELLDLPHAAAKDRAVAAFDRAYAEAMLRRTGGNTSQAARAAGMDRSNFKRLLRRSRKPSPAPAASRGRGPGPDSK